MSISVLDQIRCELFSDLWHTGIHISFLAYVGSGALLQGKYSESIYIPCAISTFSLQFPILKSTHHLLPSPHGELAPAIHAVLDVFGTPVNVVVVHNGQGLLFGILFVYVPNIP